MRPAASRGLASYPEFVHLKGNKEMNESIEWQLRYKEGHLILLGSTGVDGVVIPVKLARSLSFSSCLP